MSSANEDMNASPFFALPAEMRNMIYAYVLQTDEAPAIESEEPAITSTCKQTRSESLPMYYGQERGFTATLTESGPARLSNLIRQKNPEHIEAINSLTIIFTSLDDLPNPREEAWIGFYRTVNERGLSGSLVRGKFNIGSDEFAEFCQQHPGFSQDECRRRLDARFNIALTRIMTRQRMMAVDEALRERNEAIEAALAVGGGGVRAPRNGCTIL